MLEELTPQILMSTMLLVNLVVPVLTLLLALVMLQRYRRAVKRSMEATSGFDGDAEVPEVSGDALRSATVSGQSDDGDGLYRRALRAPWRNAAHYTVAGFGFALVYALAAHFAFPHALGTPGTLIAVWLYLWPVVLALPLIVPLPPARSAVLFLGYFGIFAVLGFWAGTVLDVPGYRFGAVVIPARSSVTPETMARLWLVLNGAPSLLMLLCLNRWIRAVAPLVLALVSASVVGILVSYFGIFSAPGTDLVVAISTYLDMHVYWLLLAALLLSLAFFGLLGWGLMRWIARAYRHGGLSDQSLLLDALWLLFASVYSMWLTARGVQWALTAPLAFLVFKLTLPVLGRFSRPEEGIPKGLTFLRVFSLGRRSELLFEMVARQWRHVGSVQLITGPDLASSTVQPHQFLDFLSGKLAHHFVSDDASLARSLAARDQGADPDGRFRVNSFFCHADSWQAVLPRLVQEGDSVLMDLRSFAAGNAGCAHELRFLVAAVPFSHCVLLVDDATDEEFLSQTLTEALDSLAATSPNRGRAAEDMTRIRIESASMTLHRIMRSLCRSVAAPP